MSIIIDGSGGEGETKAVLLEGEAKLVEEPRDFLRKQFYWSVNVIWVMKVFLLWIPRNGFQMRVIVETNSNIYIILRNFRFLRLSKGVDPDKKLDLTIRNE